MQETQQRFNHEVIDSYMIILSFLNQSAGYMHVLLSTQNITILYYVDLGFLMAVYLYEFCDIDEFMCTQLFFIIL